MTPGRSEAKNPKRQYRRRVQPLEFIKAPGRLFDQSPILPNAIDDCNDERNDSNCKPVKKQRILTNGSCKWIKPVDDMLSNVEQGRNQPGARAKRNCRNQTRQTDQSTVNGIAGRTRTRTRAGKAEHNYALVFPVQPAEPPAAVPEHPEPQRKRGRRKATPLESEGGRGAQGDARSPIQNDFTQLRPSEEAELVNFCTTLLSPAESAIESGRRASVERRGMLLTSYFPVTKHASEQSTSTSKKTSSHESPNSNRSIQAPAQDWHRLIVPQSATRQPETASTIGSHQTSAQSSSASSQDSTARFSLFKNFWAALSDNDLTSPVPTSSAATVIAPDTPEEDYALTNFRRREKARKFTAKKQRQLKRLGRKP